MPMSFQLVYAIDAACLELAALSFISVCLHSRPVSLRVLTPKGVDTALLQQLAELMTVSFLHQQLPQHTPLQRLAAPLQPYFYCLEALSTSMPGPMLLLDADTLCVADLSPLTTFKLTANYPIAACSHHRPMPDRQLALQLLSPFHYINAGVLLADPLHLASHFSVNDAVRFFEQQSPLCRFREQCVLNHMLAGRFQHLPARYNLLSWMRYRARRSPWQNQAVNPMASVLPEERHHAAIVHFSNGCLPHHLPWHQRDHFDRYWLQLHRCLQRWRQGGGPMPPQWPRFEPMCSR